MIQSLIISKLLFKLWLKYIKEILNSKSKIVLFISLSLFIFISACLVSYFFTNEILSLFLSGELRLIYLLLLTSMVSISSFSFAIFAFINNVTPEQNIVTRLLSCFPIRTINRRLGYYAPQVLIIVSSSLLFGLILYLPSMIFNKISFGIIASFYICIFLQSIFITILLFFIYNVLFFITQKIKLPYHKNITLIILTFISILYVFSYFGKINDLAINYNTFSYNLLNITAPIFLSLLGIHNFVSVNYLLVAAIVIMFFIGFYLSLLIRDCPEEKNPSKIFWFIPMPKNKFISMVLKEFKVQIRNEEIIVFNIFILIISLMLRFRFNLTLTTPLVIGVCAAISGSSAINSFGIEKDMLPLYKTTGVRLITYIISKLLGSFLLSLTMYAALLIILFSPSVSITSVVSGILILLTTVLILYLIGVIFPVSNQSPPYMQGILVFLMIPFMFPASYLVNKLSNISPLITVILILLMELILILSIISVTRKTWSMD